MAAALSLFVLLTISVFIVRVASVALRHTGLEDSSAKFQALSAISGTGFTTKEAEAVVNYPIRRRIIMALMVIGNLGVVTVMSTVVISFVSADGDTSAIITQIGWLLAMLGLLWFLAVNKTAESWMCAKIGKVLLQTTELGRRHFTRMLQISDNYSVCLHPIADEWLAPASALDVAALERLGLTVIAVKCEDGELDQHFSCTKKLQTGDALVVYGADTGHEKLESMCSVALAG